MSGSSAPTWAGASQRQTDIDRAMHEQGEMAQLSAGPSRQQARPLMGFDTGNRDTSSFTSSPAYQANLDPHAMDDAASATSATPRATQCDLPHDTLLSRYPASLGVSAPTGASDRPASRQGSEQGELEGASSSGPTTFPTQHAGEYTHAQPSPSKLTFDRQTTSRRHTSRSGSPTSPPSPPHRIPSPLPGRISCTSHVHAAGSSLGIGNSSLDAAGASSSGAHPFLSLPRSRSPDALSVTSNTSNTSNTSYTSNISNRSPSPVSPHTLEFPHTAPLGSGSFGARRYSRGEGAGQRKRPMPLDLTRGPGVGVDPELQVHMDEVASARSARSSDTSLSHEMNDLSLLRNTIRQNLHDRPIGSISDHSDSGPSEPPLSSAIQEDLDPAHTITVSELHDLHNSAEPHVILDCRSPVAYGQEHMDGSLNVSIPTLIVKRLRKGVGSKPTWETVGSYIAGNDGKRSWDGLDKNARVVLLGETGRDEVARILRDVVGGMLGPNGSAQILTGGWGNLHVPPNAVTGSRTVSGSATQPGHGGMLPPPRASRLGPVPGTAPIASQPSVFVAPPTPPNVVAPRLANQISMPSLRARRAQDQLNSGKKLPQLSLNVAPPVPARAATLDPGKRPPKSPGTLTINTGVPNAASPATSPTGHAFPMTARKSTFGNLPLRSPMAKTFGEARAAPSNTSDSKTPAPLTSLPQRPGQMVENQQQHMIDPSDIPAGGAAPGSARPAIAPFLVSTIIPNFLYLGPEILEQHEVDELTQLGVKRILNVAIECDDDGGLGLSEVFDEYHHIPMRDMVEEHNLAAGIKDAVAFLDDARLRDSPTYVHCKAGKSRSVTIVLAYLIHANAWTLKTAYSFVADRRPGISPNIGFVAELMQYAEVELGLRQHRAGQGDDGSVGAGDTHGSSGKVKRVRARDSMPAAAPGSGWSSSLQDNKGPTQLSPIPGSAMPGQPAKKDGHGTAPEPARKVDEREIRREGVWVQHRRAPKDGRLRPSRRVSKAGLETITALAVPRTPSPHPASTFTSKPTTPSAESKAGWI